MSTVARPSLSINALLPLEELQHKPISDSAKCRLMEIKNSNDKLAKKYGPLPVNNNEFQILLVDKTRQKLASKFAVNIRQIRDILNDEHQQLQAKERALFAGRWAGDYEDFTTQIDEITPYLTSYHYFAVCIEHASNRRYAQGTSFTRDQFPPRRGHHCKPTALALVDAWYADKYRVEKIPLLSERKTPVSVRKIAKKYGSLQGEVLEIGQMKNIAQEMGYQVKTIVADKEERFRKAVDKYTQKKQPLIVFYSVDGNDLYSIDTEDNPDELREHASVISSYNKKQDTLTLNHWEYGHPFIPLRQLFRSSSKLAETRQPETYTTKFRDSRKLHLEPEQDIFAIRQYKYEVLTSEGIKKTAQEHQMITPAALPGSGFRHTLLRLKPDMRHPRWKNASKKPKATPATPGSMRRLWSWLHSARVTS